MLYLIRRLREFKRDLKGVYSILPKKLKAIKINLVDYGLANFSSGLNLNYKGLIKEVELKKAFEKYLHKRLTNRHYIIYVILHEYGHAQRHISGQANYKLNRQETYFFTPRENYIDRQIDYWQYVTEEKRAWKFAKKYFKNIHLTKV